MFRKPRSARAALRLAVATLAALLGVASVRQAGSDETDQILEALELRPGMSVADVGAGEGKFTSALARGVGPDGRVFATEVERPKLDEIGRRAAADGVGNVTTVLGDQADTGLPAGCCDRILLRLVYHHFTDPLAMRSSLWRALRPGGRLALIDVPPQKDWRRLPGVPDRGGHGIPADDAVREMRGSGFELIARHDAWPAEDDSYCLVFRRPE